MEKKEFIQIVEKKLQDYVEFIETVLLDAYSKAKTPIQKKRIENHINDIKTQYLQNLIEIFKDVAQKGSELGIGQQDSEASELIEKFKNAEFAIKSLDPEKIKSKNEMRNREPLDNLESIEEPKTISMSKDQIEDKLIELNEQKNNAISETEKNEIGNKIKYYMRLYQESSLRGRKA